MISRKTLNCPVLCCGVVVLSVVTGCRDNTETARSTDATPSIPNQPTTSAAMDIPAIELERIDHEVAAAIRDAQQQVRQSPSSAAQWGRLGMILLAHDHRSAAADCFARAQTLNRTEPRWPLLVARAVEVANVTQAIQLMQNTMATSVEKLPPDVAVAMRLRLAGLLIDAQRIDEAEQQVRQALLAAPANGRAHFELARIEFVKENFKACLSELRNAESLGVVRQQASLLAAEAHRRLGDDAAAQQQRERSTTLSNSPWPDPLFQSVVKLRTGLKARLSQAERLYAQNQVQSSITLLRETIRQHPRFSLGADLVRTRAYSPAQPRRSQDNTCRSLRVVARLRRGKFSTGSDSSTAREIS